MAINKKIIDSFYLQKELNPKIWDKTNKEDYKLKSEIRKKLLSISDIFVDYLDVPFFVHDILFIGSLAGYNWSEYSDFDIHVVIDLSDAGEKKELYEELFRLKKTIFNSKHDIKIKGYETELFVEDLNQGNVSMGVYSLVENKWLKSPEKENFTIDENKIKQKAEQWMDGIDDAIEKAENSNLSNAIKIVDKYKEKLRKYRTCGLKKEGEFSYENLVFKYLRRNGYISKLKDFKNKVTNKKLSLEQEFL